MLLDKNYQHQIYKGKLMVFQGGRKQFTDCINGNANESPTCSLKTFQPKSFLALVDRKTLTDLMTLSM